MKDRQKGIGGMSRRKIDERIFYWGILALPLLQFCLFWVGVNFNSILLALQKIEVTAGQGTVYSWVGFANFSKCFDLLANDTLLKMCFKNSMISYLFGVFFGTGFSLFFSYYIYKNKLCSNFFKIMLFIPSIISSVAMVVMFEYFVENAYPAIMSSVFNKTVSGLLAESKTAFWTILFYNLWAGFGGGILLYLGEMNTISDSVVEAAYLDGITPVKEFFLITLPLIYKTLCVFLVTGMAGFFNNTMNLYTFYGERVDSRLFTYGHYMFINTKNGITNYPMMAALGLIFTIIIAPITLVSRWLFAKFGPSVE